MHEHSQEDPEPSVAGDPEPSHGRLDSPLLRPGQTCWRRVEAGRIAFLIDGQAYFGALADALENARHSVWLVGWDFHSSVELRRGSSSGESELVGLLEGQVRKHRSLRIRALAWDFAMLYALEREFLPLLQFGARTHRRIEFAMDAQHPVAASHHQKLAVIDDAMAFAGGFDLTSHRWDTREHRAADGRRVTPAGRAYGPFHDVQIAVDGQAASAIADLARQRWEGATGHRVEPVPREAFDPWPRGLQPWVRDATVGIARTQPSHRGSPEIREVEALYRESIRAARRWIYIENQYLTSPQIAEWLAEGLVEPAGPEVVIIGPRENDGWLEQKTMGVLRAQVIRRLRAADLHDRLRILWPQVPDLAPDETLNVHSKVMVVDDSFARVGSSNLSSRSLGLDTECDLALEAEGRGHVERAIARLRNDLLAEHLGADVDRVSSTLELTGSLVATVDALRGGPRTLQPIAIDETDAGAGPVDPLRAVDPEHPAPLEDLLGQFEEERDQDGEQRGWSLWDLPLSLVAVAAMALLWRSTAMADWIAPERLAGMLDALRSEWYAPAIATGSFVVAAVALVPVVALTVAAGLVLGPVAGIGVAWVGSVLAAAVGYAIGRRLWRDTVRRIAGGRLNTLSQRLARQGLLATALVRIVPVAPFMVVNVVAGASHVRSRDFLLGTTLGMLPGTVLLVVAADRVSQVFRHPSSGLSWLGALAAVGLAGVAAVLLRRRSLFHSKLPPS